MSGVRDIQFQMLQGQKFQQQNLWSGFGEEILGAWTSVCNGDNRAISRGAESPVNLQPLYFVVCCVDSKTSCDSKKLTNYLNRFIFCFSTTRCHFFRLMRLFLPCLTNLEWLCQVQIPCKGKEDSPDDITSWHLITVNQ